MTYDNNARIIGNGTVSTTAIQQWFIALGPNYTGYAPDGRYKAPPDDLGTAIVAECRRYPDHIVNHDLVAGQILKETAAWQSKYARERNNPGGIGAVNYNPDLAIHFPSVAAGVRAHIAHLLTYAVGDGPWAADTPRYANVKAAGWVGVAPRWIDLNGRWAFPGTTYGQDIVKLGNQLQAFAATQPKEEPPMTTKPRIALAAGHHNSNRGGAAGEYERVGPLTREIASQLRSHGGFDVHVITPNDGMGDYPGGLQDVAREAVRLNADCFLEVHMEGVGNPAVRGCFAIYPDTPPDVDADVRDRLGLDMARRVRDRTGLPLRGNGTMSERSTGVGGQGYRLGAFSASASARQTMERMLFEYGTLTNSADTQIINGTGFNAQAARATVESLIAFYDVAVAPDDPQPQPDPDALYQTANPFGQVPIRAGFRGLFESVGQAKYPDDPMAGGLSVCGYAESEEYATAFGSAQRFQRVTMLYYRDAAPPWDLVMQHRFEVPPEPLREEDAA